MPKNTKKQKNTKNVTVQVKEFVVRTDEQEYAKIIKPLGNHRMLCQLYDGTEKLGIIRKKLRGKKHFMTVDDVVLVSTREFQDDKVDIINVYTDVEVKKLVQMKELPKEGEEDTKLLIFSEDELEDCIDILMI
jgi:translation initiation factor 1A